MKFQTRALILTILLQLQNPFVSGGRVLFLIPFASKSHKNVFDPIALGLNSRGHNVTIIAPVTSTKFPTNITQLGTHGFTKSMSGMPNPFVIRSTSKWTRFSIPFNTGEMIEATRAIYNNPQFLHLINQTYDLVFLNAFLNEGFDGVVHKLGAPFIIVSTLAPPSMITELTGNHLPPSFVPNPMLEVGDRMTFGQRTLNLLSNHLMEFFFRRFIVTPLESVYKEIYGPETPDGHVIRQNVSLILMNSHFSLTHPRPNLPDNIEVGGMHCRPPNKLPADLEAFVSGAKDGFILFSLGSIVQANTMPEEYQKIFLRVFSKLTQRVLWKWESEEPMTDLPLNVKVSKWLPQQDILGHPNIRLFITHGGLLSTQEAVYFGVPVLGIPIFADQDMNVNQLVGQGYGLGIEIMELNEEELLTKIQRILNEKSFKDTAQHLSQIFLDKQNTPLDTALYWSEYVMRHKGAPHLRSAARDLNFFQIHSWDVYGALVSILIFIIFILKVIVQKVLRVFVNILTNGNRATSRNKRKNE